MHYLRATLPLVCPAVQPVHITFDVTCVDEVAGWEDSALAAVHAVKHDGNVVCFVEGTWSSPAVKGLVVSTTSPADGVLRPWGQWPPFISWMLWRAGYHAIC
jgi:hypothetical protein